MPSLHSAYPVLVFLNGLKRLKYWNIVLGLHMAGIWFSAIYLRHHYILDVSLGIIYAVIIFFLFDKVIPRTKLNEKLEQLEMKI